MKKLLLLILLAVLYSSAFAQKKDSVETRAPLPVSLDSVGNYVGNVIKVKGRVFGVKETGKVAFINVGAAFPNAVLTLFVPTESLNNFKDVLLSSYVERRSLCMVKWIYTKTNHKLFYSILNRL